MRLNARTVTVVFPGLVVGRVVLCLCHFVKQTTPKGHRDEINNSDNKSLQKTAELRRTWVERGEKIRGKTNFHPHARLISAYDDRITRKPFVKRDWKKKKK